MSSLWFNDRQQKFLFMRIIIDATRTNHCKCFIRTGVTRKRHLILQHLFRSMGVWHLFMQNKRVRRLKPNSNCLLFKRGAMRALGCVFDSIRHIYSLSGERRNCSWRHCVLQCLYSKTAQKRLTYMTMTSLEEISMWNHYFEPRIHLYPHYPEIN